VGSYREYLPPRDLQSHVACTWVRIVADVHPRTANPIIPDGCVDVITYGCEPPQVAGPATETQWVDLPPQTVVTGIRFLPAAARDVLHTPVDLLRNSRVDLTAVCDRHGVALTRSLEAADVPASRRALMAEWTRHQLETFGARDLPLIAAARWLRQGATIDAVAQRLGWNTRRLHRHCVASCGYGPKMLQRVIRLQRALRIAQASVMEPVALIELAVLAGYADQSHMTHDFRTLTGFTPAAYLARADPNVGAWLDAADDPDR
jgi:AraC-like DNA-binding protein